MDCTRVTTVQRRPLSFGASVGAAASRSLALPDAMLHGAIVPEQQIARLPLVAIDEDWLDNVIG
jgi:hypothetical protein